MSRPTKLPDDVVIKIRTLFHKEKIKVKDIAEKMNLGVNTVTSIVYYKTYKNVKNPERWLNG